MTNRRTIVSLALLALLPLAQAATQAAFPARPVTLIVPTPPGGPSDTAARLVARSLSNAWGQTVVVENRAGANGAIAAQAVMAAVPDGYTLLWSNASMAGLPYVMKSPPYRSMTELAFGAAAAGDLIGEVGKFGAPFGVGFDDLLFGRVGHGASGVRSPI